MLALDGIFDSVDEIVTATVSTIDWLPEDSPYTIYIHGQDALLNWGPHCIFSVTVESTEVPTPTPTNTQINNIPVNNSLTKFVIFVILLMISSYGALRKQFPV